MLYHGISYGPIFGGGHDIYISDKANQNNLSQFNINHTYINKNYNYGS
jgi:hypothetical protein